jgi:hypothetical protein
MTESADLLDTDQSSEFLKRLGLPLEPTTLAVKRVRGGGPIYVKSGRRVFYRPAALREFANANMREMAHTSQAAAA